ncbi:MAG: hypothetical protein MUF75_07850 [Bacteroidia bacterium]|jgi:uncharacterized membrane protein|nr:hypothetical protein [Bacteroidia bacterium]
MQTPEQNDAFHKDPNNWKWGLFYYNPLDERLFLPKKNPMMGITLNFAKPEAFWLTLLLLSIPTVLLVVSFKK